MKSVRLTRSIKDDLIEKLVKKANLDLFDERKKIGGEVSAVAQEIADTYYRSPEDKATLDFYGLLSDYTYITLKPANGNEIFTYDLHEFRYLAVKCPGWNRPTFKQVSEALHTKLKSLLEKEKVIQETMASNRLNIEITLMRYTTSKALLQDIPDLEAVLKEVLDYEEPTQSSDEQIEFLKKIAAIPDKPLLTTDKEQPNGTN